MQDNMILIMKNECGEEVQVAGFKVGYDLDEGYMELWKEQKIEEARREYPEAQGFYFEDRRDWARRINEIVGDNTFYDPWEDEIEEETEAEEDDDFLDEHPDDFDPWTNHDRSREI